MRAKVSIWARGLAAVAAAGAAIVFLGAGTASTSASRSVPAAHVAVGQTAAVSAEETTWY
jgi:hypothetical protein